MFCPVGENIVTNYDEIINSNEKTFITKNLFNANHKLIDHIKTNKRIIAQQGAFILFQGNDYKKIPERISYTIDIPSEAKSNLRRELKELFGIYTGSVYPQPVLRRFGSRVPGFRRTHPARPAAPRRRGRHRSPPR